MYVRFIIIFLKINWTAKFTTQKDKKRFKWTSGAAIW